MTRAEGAAAHSGSVGFLLSFAPPLLLMVSAWAGEASGHATLWAWLLPAVVYLLVPLLNAAIPHRRGRLGAAITERGIDLGRTPDPETEIVVIWFDPVSQGASTRLRIWETYTDPGRYLLHGDELVWDRNFGRARNTVVLPEGWSLAANSIPGVIDETEDGRIRIRYINPRPDGIQVFVRGRRR